MSSLYGFNIKNSLLNNLYQLRTAMAGRADYLVSGDGDLLALKALEPIRIVLPAEFERILGG